MTIAPDHNTEQLILANAIQSTKHHELLCDLISPNEFFINRHKNICDVLIKLRNEKLPLHDDNILLYSKQSSYKPECDLKYLMTLKEAFPDLLPDIDIHIKKLKSDFIKNELITKSIPQLVERISDPMSNLSDIADSMDKDIKLIDSGSLSTELDLKTINDILPEYTEIIEKRKKGLGTYPTGFRHLNKELVEGFAPKKLTVLASRSSMGKSSTIAAMIVRLSQQNVPSALFALEMDKIAIVDKIVSIRSKIELSKIIKDRKSFTPEEEKRFEEELAILAKNKYLYIDDKPNIDLNYMKQQVLLLKRKLQAEYIVVFIDLFGQVSDIMESKETNTATAYEKKLRSAHILCKDLNIHLVLVNQLNRELLKNKNKRPEIHHLKNSGAWEEVADNILLLHRSKYYEPDLEEDVLEVWIKKQRMGERNKMVPFLFDSVTTDVKPTDILPEDMRSSKGPTEPDKKVATEIIKSNFVSKNE